MPQVVDPCPECQSDDRFYHCHRGCNTPTHVVTCNKCKTDYLTTERIIDYEKRTQAYSRHDANHKESDPCLSSSC